MILAPEMVSKLNIELQKIPRNADLILMALMELSNHFQNPRAQLYLREGVMRRVGIIKRCIERIFEIHPPTRETLLSRSELDDLTIYLQTFAGHVYGVLDNLAWVCVLLAGEDITTRNRMGIGLFKSGTKEFLPPLLNEYLSDGKTKEWFDKYAKSYRDSTAHRVPVYVPPKMLNPAEAEEFNILERRSMEALLGMDVDLHERLYAQQEALGGPANIMLLTSSDEEERTPEIPFHPQVICDWLTVHELLEKYTAGICQQYGFVVRTRPIDAGRPD